VASSPWVKSKAGLGNIGPIDRARVQDLQQADPEKPLTPSQRAMQKGVVGCGQVLACCLEGVTTTGFDSVVVCEFLVSRPWFSS